MFTRIEHNSNDLAWLTYLQFISLRVFREAFIVMAVLEAK